MRSSGEILEKPVDLRLAIVGAGGMARVLARIFRGRVSEIAIISRSPERARRLSRRLGISCSTMKSIGEYDAVILTTPSQYLAEAVERIAPHLREGALLMDISSVKLGVVEKVLSLIPSGVEYLSIHPLFGPAARKLAGNRVILIPVRGSSRIETIKMIFEDAGLRVAFSTPEKHDEIMAYVQVAHHLSYLALALTLHGAGPDILEDYATRSLKKTMSMLKMLHGNLRVIREIAESNRYAGRAAEALKTSIDELARGGDDVWRRVEEALRILPAKAA
ncbi:MAG: prephenate dehydrogenase [Nitrososphaerota archaeon]